MNDDKRWTGKIDLNQPVPDPFGDGKTHEWIESHDLSEWYDRGIVLFWDDLRRDMADPEYAKLHAKTWREVRARMVADGLVAEKAVRRATRRLKWRSFWWGFWHPFADPRKEKP